MTKEMPAGASGFIGTVLTAMGEEKGLAYLRKLAKQNIVSLGVSARQVFYEVISGSPPLERV